MNKIQSKTAKAVFSKNVGRLKGLEIWRIEKFEPVSYPKKDYGKFFTGDSFIVLNTKENNGVFSHDIHFWLGRETTQDEAGSAAILAVHLDDFLGGSPVQHREVQDHESVLFLSYFKNGIRYLPGGVQSGFNKVTTNAEGEQRLFQVKGKRNIRIRQVALTLQSMNNNDYFILDTGRKIFVYPPNNSKLFQKNKANDVAKQIRDQDHNGRASVHILDHPISMEDRREFFSALGCQLTNPVIPHTPDDDDHDLEIKEHVTIILYSVSKAGCLKVATKPLKQDMLKTEMCFLLDTGCGIFVWVGKEAPAEEKSHLMEKAQEFISKHKYPTWTLLHRIVEGAETVLFKQYFASWREQNIIKLKFVEGKDHAMEIDPKTLHSRKKGGRGEFTPGDNGNGTIELWRVQDRELVHVREDMRGIFFDKNCYVIKYTFEKKKGGVIYFWQGRHATILDKGASALQTVDLASKMDGGAIQILVNQGYEPRHFLLIFKGKVILMFGNHLEFMKNRDNNIKPTNIRLFKIRGTTENDVHAEQLDAYTSNLASDDTFILATTTCTFVWNGVGTSDFEKKMALESVKRLVPDVQPQIIQEGSEPMEFWKALGGKGNYDKELDKPGPPFLDSRLFHCKILNNGKFVVKEVLNFCQDDLDIDDVFVMDGGDEIYIWEGKECSQKEKEKSVQIANMYIRTDPSDRTPESVPIIAIQQGNEPKSFKQLFPKWKNNFWK